MLGAVLVALLALAAPSAAAPARPRVAFVVSSGEADARPVLERLEKSLDSSAALSTHELATGLQTDPIAKGRLLASLRERDLVVAVGDAATDFVTLELEDQPVYFVGAGTVAGERLASRLVSGTFSYSVEALLDAVKIAAPGTLGLAWTPGYEPVAAWIRQGAAARGIPLVEKRVAALKELPAAFRELSEKAKSIWALGDPLLVRGAGFEFLRERSLSRELPLVGAGSSEVRRGALLGWDPSADALAAEASAALADLLGRGSAAAGVRPGPRAGAVVYNGALAERWSTPTGGPRWRALR